MLFALHLIDRFGAADIRARLRPEHRAYIAQFAERIAFAGPLLSDDGQTPAGSLIVMEFDTRAAVHDWLRDEPYTRAGLYGSVAIHAFNNLFPQKVGFVAA